MNRALHGSCHVPVAAIAQWQGPTCTRRAWSAVPVMAVPVRAEAIGPASDPEQGQRVAKMLLDAGAGELLNV